MVCEDALEPGILDDDYMVLCGVRLRQAGRYDGVWGKTACVN